MKLIRKRRNFYALFLAVNISLTTWFARKLIVEAAFAFGLISLVCLFMLVRQIRMLYLAKLISDNHIFSVRSAIISMTGRKENNETEEIVVSTFGVLIASKVYQWGCNGLEGIRLKTIDIDRERVYFTFGDATQTIRVELLHGIGEEQTVMDITQKLLDETGVRANISGWESKFKEYSP